MAMCKQCGIEKLSNEFPPVTVSDECDHPPLACLRVSKQTFIHALSLKVKFGHLLLSHVCMLAIPQSI